MQFEKATKTASRLRLALIGPSGAGKTYTALTIAMALADLRVAVIDTERGSAAKYADRFDFDVVELERHSPADYVDAIDVAVASGTFDVLIVDSLSHAWIGRGGALEQVDAAAERSNNKSTFAAWRHVTPQHNKLVDAICAAPLHVIATMRSKTEWVLEPDARGKTRPRKVGTQAVQRDGVEFEFDVVGDMDAVGNVLHVTKSRCPDLQNARIEQPGADVADTLRKWLAGEVTPFGRACAAVMAAASWDALQNAAGLAQGLTDDERKRLAPIYALRRDRLTATAAGPAAGVDARTDRRETAGETHAGAER